MKEHIDNLVIEITRRCNMTCGHCLRGVARDDNMSEDVINAVMSKLEYVMSVTISGGEPSLAMKLIKYVLDSQRIFNTSVGNYYMVTNGLCTTPTFLDLLERMKEAGDMPEDFRLSISNDPYHDEVPGKKLDKLLDFGEEIGADNFNGTVVHQRDHNHLDNPDRVIQMGRGSFVGASKAVIHPFEIVEDGGKTMAQEGLFYIDVFGDVWPGCDLSYTYMESHRGLCLGSVLDDDFSFLAAAESWNRTCDNKLIKVMEELT